MNSPTPASLISRPSIQIIRWSGYGLLILTLSDLFTLLFPLGFTNPVWEFQTFGAIVDRIPVPMLSLAMIFFGESQFRRKWELKLVSMLSWACLVGGIVLFLFLPLGAKNTARLQEQIANQFDVTYRQQLTQVQQVQQRLNQSSNEDFAQLLKQNRIAFDSSQEPREQFLAQLVQYREQVKVQLDREQQAQSKTLLKNAAKWNFGALISGFLFIGFWRLTRWTRRKQSTLMN